MCHRFPHLVVFQVQELVFHKWSLMEDDTQYVLGGLDKCCIPINIHKCMFLLTLQLLIIHLIEPQSQLPLYICSGQIVGNHGYLISTTIFDEKLRHNKSKKVTMLRR